MHSRSSNTENSVLDRAHHLGGLHGRNRHRLSFLRQGLGLALERVFQNLVDPLDRTDVQTILDVICYFGQVFDILFRDQNGLDSAAVRR